MTIRRTDQEICERILLMWDALELQLKKEAITRDEYNAAIEGLTKWRIEEEGKLK